MTTLLGHGQYAALARYANTPGARGLAQEHRTLIVAEATALAGR